MIIKMKTSHHAMRATSLGVAVALMAPTLVGCGSSQQATPPPAMQAPNARNIPPGIGAPPAERRGMSTKQKMVLLAGAAAIYYLYKKKQNEKGQPVQYYRSRNGGIYYRDPKTKRAVYVTPATVSPLQVPAEDAEEMRGYRGYNNNPRGRDLTTEIPLG